MGFLFLVLLASLGFGGVVLFYRRYPVDTLYVVAIGSVVAANIFDIRQYGINVGGLVYGVDSVVYTLFIFCVVMMLIREGKGGAKKLMFSSMAAIFYASVIQLIASWATVGMSMSIVWSFVSFGISILGTFAAVSVAIWVYGKTVDKTGKCWGVVVFLLLASVVNTLIFYGVSAVMHNGLGESFLAILAGSYIGKTLAMAYAVGVYMVLRRHVSHDSTQQTCQDTGDKRAE